MSGQLGDGTTTDSYPTPVEVSMPAGINAFTLVTAGKSHTCAVSMPQPKLYCWGKNTAGQLGDETTAQRNTPVAVSRPAGVSAFTSVFPGYTHTCGTGDDGKAYCWGSNTWGRLGFAAPLQSNIPAPITLPVGVTSFSSVGGGWQHSCGIGSDGKTYCWGSNTSYQFGDGTASSSPTPVQTSLPFGVTFTSVKVGYTHTCAIGSDGNAYCWGVSANGQLGDNTAGAGTAVPVKVVLPGGVTSFTSVVAGGFHSCGIGNDGNAYCWGKNDRGQLGYGPMPIGNQYLATQVIKPVGVTSFVSLTAGYSHTCGIGNNGATYCWGYNSTGQIGFTPMGINRDVPTPVNMPGGVASYTSIFASDYHTCGIANTGTTYCWGWNSTGQLGNGLTTNSETPVAVTLPTGISGFTSLTGGWGHSCAIGL